MLIFITAEAQKQYNKLQKSEQKKIKRKLISLENYPYSGKKLSGELEEKYSLRVWPYRIIYKINKDLRKIEIESILHRQGVYK